MRTFYAITRCLEIISEVSRRLEMFMPADAASEATLTALTA
jgi:hypothetical protein